MNSQRLIQRAGLASQTAYRWLLMLYPADFRGNYGFLMTQAFRDLTRDAQAHSGLIGFLSLWRDTIKDLVSSIWKEQFNAWRRGMQPKTMITLLIGSIFLGISGLFVAVNLIQYQFGIDLPWNPFDKILDSTQGTPLRIVFDSVIILGPVVAVAFFFLPYIKIRWRPGEDEITSIVLYKVGTLSLVLIALSALVVGSLGLYVIAENLPCLIGQQVSC